MISTVREINGMVRWRTNREGKEQLGRILNQVTREALYEEVMSLKPEGRTSFITMSVSNCRDTGT